eukprot:gnl/Dysnectes_brevis/3746_a4808_1150.p1 GENE.gnl/Dysnectes_brevis/3746_a4808_1150~~gnl/Dysnectes_brevis/3746_a4808_1150.p1  ORF type:complete len:198 (+),score=8.76 gnl/Dysnectes_brevis/3746_a4808_1150:121-714(+)
MPKSRKHKHISTPKLTSQKKKVQKRFKQAFNPSVHGSAISVAGGKSVIMNADVDGWHSAMLQSDNGITTGRYQCSFRIDVCRGAMMIGACEAGCDISSIPIIPMGIITEGDFSVTPGSIVIINIDFDNNTITYELGGHKQTDSLPTRAGLIPAVGMCCEGDAITLVSFERVGKADGKARERGARAPVRKPYNVKYLE